MFDVERMSEWRGLDVVDPAGQRVGRLDEIYTDNYGTSPGFACVRTGLFGRRLSFVPLTGATPAEDHIRVAYPADQIKHAPSVEPDGTLTGEEEAALFAHYGLDAEMAPPLGSPEAGFPASTGSTPRLMRYHTEAAAAHLTEARQIAATDVAEAREMAVARDRHDPDAGLGGAAHSAIDARLRALEERVAALESLRGR
ncbi:MAG: PRC-barrel domain-containing protein [Actinobacteria bacterium]|nr:PRC-barrel domain-containing protein [Actinomycetota bacterium]